MYVYVSGGLTGDTIAMAELAHVLDDFGHPASVRRALDQIVDTRSILGREFGEFIHYSFYEYLVARHVADVILSDPTPGELAETLRHDLTREVRPI
jgi:DNA-binding transcriptional regulator PaaX